MPELSVFNIDGTEAGKISASEEIFGVKVNPCIMYDAVTQQLALKRRGTASTKTRCEVRGGGRKPFKQKGTGKARAGTIRSPLWRGGGVTFGPKPRKYGTDLPVKVKRLAMKGVLSLAVAEGKIGLIDNFKLSQPKTKELNKILVKFPFKKLLLITDDKDIMRASRNIPTVKTIHPQNINTYDLLNCDRILIAKDIFLNLESKMKNKGGAI